MMQAKLMHHLAFVLCFSLGMVFATDGNARPKKKNVQAAAKIAAVNDPNLIQLRCVEVRRNQTERTMIEQIFFRIDLNTMVFQEQRRTSNGWDFPSTPQALGDGNTVTATTIRFKTFDLDDVKQISKTIDRTTGLYSETYALFGESRVRNNGAPLMTVSAQCSREPWTGYDAPPDKTMF